MNAPKCPKCGKAHWTTQPCGYAPPVVVMAQEPARPKPVPSQPAKAQAVPSHTEADYQALLAKVADMGAEIAAMRDADLARRQKHRDKMAARRAKP